MFWSLVVCLLVTSQQGGALSSGEVLPKQVAEGSKLESAGPLEGDVCNMKRIPQPAPSPEEYFVCRLPTEDAENWPWPQIGLWIKRVCKNGKVFSPLHSSCRRESDIRRFQQRACQQWPESCGVQIEITCGGAGQQPCPQPFQPQPQPQPYIPEPMPYIPQPQPYIPQPEPYQPCQPPQCPQPYVPESQPYVPQPYIPEPQLYVPQPQPCQPPQCPQAQPYIPAPQPYIPPTQPYIPEPEPYQPCQPPQCPQPQPYIPQPQPYVPQPQQYIPQPQPYVPQPQPYIPQPQPCQPPQTCGGPQPQRPVDNTPRPCQAGGCSWMMEKLRPGQSPNTYQQCVPVSNYCGKWMTRPCARGTRFDVRVQVCVHAEKPSQPQQPSCGGSSVPLGPCNSQQQCPGYSQCQQSTNTCCQVAIYVNG